VTVRTEPDRKMLCQAVHHAVVLHVGTGTDNYGAQIPPKTSTRPDETPFADDYLSYEGSLRVNEGTGSYGWGFALKRVDGHRRCSSRNAYLAAVMKSILHSPGGFLLRNFRRLPPALRIKSGSRVRLPNHGWGG